MNGGETRITPSHTIVKRMDDSPDSEPEPVPMEKELSAGELQRLEREMTDLLNFLGKKHTLAIQRQFAYSDGPLRFSDLEDVINISPNTLSNRLKEFTEAGLLTRHSYDEIPPRVEYEMTAKSRDLKPIFSHLSAWVDRHELDSGDSIDVDDPADRT